MQTDSPSAFARWPLFPFLFAIVALISACSGGTNSSGNTGGDATTTGTAGASTGGTSTGGTSTGGTSTGGTTAGGGGSGGNVGGGGTPECAPDQKPCGGACVALDDPKFGCDDPTCTPCSGAHAVSGCVAGACAVLQCDAPWADCDGDAANGCEADLQSDPANCDACGAACGPGKECSGGACVIACPQGKASCDGDDANGCETDLGTMTDCASCGDSCDLANATGTCAADACAVVACDPGFADCDSDPASGCEASLKTATNCGACGIACGAGENCVNGQCAAPSPCAILPEVCNGLDDDCDGQVDEALTQPCATACGSGVITCAAGQWGACSAPKPTAEVCGNGVDDDCDGNVDDAALVNGQMKTCVSGCGSTGGNLAVSITNVADLAKVGAPLGVTGTVTGAIDGWYLEWAADGSAAYTVLQSGNANVMSGPVGTLDPTLLENGIIHLRLRAVGCNGVVVQDLRDVKITGENKIGDVALTYEDMRIQVVGVAIQVLRKYDSRKRATKGDFGQGWSLSLGTKAAVTQNIPVGQSWTLTCPPVFGQPTQTELKGHDIEVRLNEHELYRFKPVLSNITYAFQGACQGYVTFQQTGGRPGAKLQSITNNYVLWLNDGSTSLYVDVDYTLWDLKDLRLTTLGGREYDFKYGGSLTRIGDANGNAVQVQANGLVNQPSGVGVTFAKDASGRITQATGPDGKAVKYTYGPTGDLLTVTDRKDQVTTFSYYQDHLLERVVDPAGTTPVRLEYDADGRLKKQFDANQNPEILSFDPLAGTAAVTGVNGATTTAKYDANGQLIEVATPIGLPVKYEYDSNGNVTKKTDELGQVWTYTYDAKWSLASETDPAGHTTSWTSSYDAGGKLTKMIIAAPLTAPQTLEYAPSGALTKVTTSAGVVRTMGYDAKGQRTSTSELSGGATITTSDAYDSAGRKTSQVGVSGEVTQFEYDARGRLTKRIAQHDPPVPDDVTTYQYDDNDQLVLTTDPQGNQTGTTYDASGLPVTITSPGGVIHQAFDPKGRLTLKTYPPTPQAPTGAKEAYAYDEQGNISAILDRDGVFVEYQYDALGRRTKEIAGDGSEAITQYDAKGRRTKTIDALGHARTWEIDAVGHVTKRIDEAGAITLLAYDAAGRVTQVIDPLGSARQFQYDSANRQTAIVYPDATSEHFEYDNVGRQTKSIDRGGQIRSRAYDGAGHVTSMTDENGQTTTYGYDDAGRVTSVTDPNGNALTTVFDSAGRVLERYLPGSAVAETYGYDAVGRLTQKVGFDGLTTTYAHDANGNLTKQTIQTPGGGMPTVYNIQPSPGGLRATVSDAHGSTTYSYDSLTGRLTEIATPEGTLSYGYDLAGHITSRTTPEGTTSYAYDQAGRVTSMMDSRIGTVTYAHDALGRLLSVTMPDGGTTAYTHDAMSRLLSVTHTAPNGTVLASFTHQYDANGRRTQITETTAGGTVNVIYAYDAKGQLTQENRPTGLIAYGYDAAGQRTSKTDVNGSVVYTYDAQGKLTSSTDEDFSYDAAGRLTKRQDKNGANITTYEYDAEGRLLKLTPPDGAVMSFAYDIDGIRYTQTVAGDKTDYLVDPVRAYAEVVGELDGNGQPIASYVYGGYGRAAEIRGNVKSFYLSDAQSVRSLRHAGAQTVSDSYTYDAFGEVLAASGSTPNVYGFQGEATDATGLLYMRARYYDPSTGRFLSRDPMSSEPPYAFVHNSPPNNTDPSGTQTLAGQGAAMAGMGILLVAAYPPLPKMIQDLLNWWRDRRLSGTTPTYFGLGALGSHAWNPDKSIDEVKGDLVGAEKDTISLVHISSTELRCEGTARGDAGQEAFKGDNSEGARYTSGELSDNFQGFLRLLLEQALKLRKKLAGMLPECTEEYAMINDQIDNWTMGNCAEKAALFNLFEACGATTDDQKKEALCQIDDWDTVIMKQCKVGGLVPKHRNACAQCCLFFVEIQKEAGAGCPVQGVVGDILQQQTCQKVLSCLGM